jgi:hypothetical protein
MQGDAKCSLISAMLMSKGFTQNKNIIDIFLFFFQGFWISFHLKAILRVGFYHNI